MIQKWKKILTNWINCYFNENDNEKVQYITLECLLNIISHLHKSLNLDESRSSTLDAQTVEEFILEKFPEFKFENGTVEATDEDDLYLVASLLLFFVCVNSKDMDIKYAMCSKLSTVDQEIILKFSKCLMECSLVTCRDVQAAFTEACGQDTATMDNQPTVSETPPALRSLHSEVRRLQAALDAERFDRNYLQEELARCNLKFEKLLKDKEQYKLEILNLRTKISLCCSQEAETSSEYPDNAVPTKLTKQLEELEERLIETQSQLDNVQCERDSYKAKINELRQERDKWLVLSQQESSRADQLVEELQTERQNVQSLRELITELRQHNQLKGLSTSQIECDDPDTSIHSPHNLSVCSEACVNVVEVQLGEERAKIEVLKQQIQTLQDQLNELNFTSLNKRHKLQEQITERDTEICILKQRINEEIVEKNDLKANFNDEISKLNNDINELQQKLRDNSESSRINIEKKIQEIQILQEEKLSLLQSLSDETTKLDKIIKELQVDIATEKNCRSKMKEDYENHIMKLNEKVLNRNNELVELQNNIFEKSEMIEKLHFDLRKEKELNEDLSNKCNNEILHLNKVMSVVELNLQQKSEEATELQKQLQQSLSMNDELKKEINYLSTYTTQLEATSKHLEDSKGQLSFEIKKRDDNLELIQKHMENLQNTFSEEKQLLLQDLHAKDTSLKTLTEQIGNEIQNKNSLQNEITLLQEAEMKLNGEIMKLNNETSILKMEDQEKDHAISVLELHIEEEKTLNGKLKHDCECLNEKLKNATEENDKKLNAIKLIKEKQNNQIKSFEEILNKSNNDVQTLNSKLIIAIEEKNALLIEISTIREEKESMSVDISNKSSEIINLQSLLEKMFEKLEGYEKAMESIEGKLEMESMKFEELKENYDTEKAKLVSKFNDYEKEIAKLESQSIGQEQEKKSLLQEIHDLNKKLHITISTKEKIEKEYKMLQFLKEDIVRKDNELNALQNEIQVLKQSLEVKCEEIKAMEVKWNQQTVSSQHAICQKTSEVKDLQEKLTELQSLNKEREQHLKNETDNKIQEITALQEKNTLLQITLDEDNTNYKALLKEQDTVIKILKQEIKTQCDEITELRSVKQQLERKMENETQCKTEEIHALQNDIQRLQVAIEENNANHQELLKDKDAFIDKLEDELKAAFENVTVLQLRNENVELQLNTEMQGKIEEIEVLQKENENLQCIIKQDNTSHEVHLKDKDDIIKKLEQEIKSVDEKIADMQTVDDNLQQLLKNEIESKQLEIQALQKENEHLQYVIEEDNSNHQTLLLLKDKDAIIERLELQIEAGVEKLQSLQKEYEEERLTLAKCKVELQMNLEANNSKIENLEEVKKTLENNLIEAEKVKEDLINKINIMTRQDENIQNERQNVTQNLLEERRLEEMKYAELLRERDDLLSRLISEKSSRDLVEIEKGHLVEENETLYKQLTEEKIAGNYLVSENNTLLNEKKILTQELLEQTLIKEIVDKEKQTLSEEKLILVQQLTEESLDKKSLLEQKELLTQQLVEEKSARELTEQEKVNILKIKEALITESTVTQSELITDKETLEQEMEMIMRILSEEKAARDEIESEKNTQLRSLMATNEERLSDIKDRDEQLTILTEELRNLKTDCLKQEELNIQLTSTVTNGLEKLFQNLQEEQFNTNQILHNFLTVDSKDMQIDDKCKLLINIVDVLITELSIKKNLEKALQHETSTLDEMKELIKHKEMHLQELQAEVKDLQQQIYQNKIEVSKQTESFTTSLDSKDREYQKVQNENQSLRNELNDVRIQLEVKCHSLKEKLINNENITDKLKSTYECQINNLNVMMNKLTSYLKDKTIELDAIRIEKDKLQQVIEENSSVIKTLEKEVKTEKQNQEKLISDFESERLVLKNMVTVTESVMDDQKVGLNKLISDHIKANEILQEEIKSLTEQIESVKRNSEMKVKEKESAFEIAFNELRELKSEKENLEKDVKELKTEIIQNLKEELISKESINEALEIQNKKLTEKLEKCENDVAELQNMNDEEKIKKDSLQVELKDKVDILAKTVNEKSEQNLKLEATLIEKMQQNVEMENKVKDLRHQIEKLVTEKSALELQKCECVHKFDDMMQKIDTMTKEHEEFAKLTNDNVHLYQQIEQNKAVIASLEQKMQLQLDQKQQYNETDNEKLNLANKCALLQEYQNKAEKELEDRQKELEKQHKELEEQQKAITLLRNEVEGLRSEVEMLQQEVMSISNEKDSIISEIKKELEDEKRLKERFLEELHMKTAAINELRYKLGDARNDEVLTFLMRENEELIKAIGQRETFTAICQEKSTSVKSHLDKDSREPRQQVDNTSDLTHSSLESIKTISDLEKIIHDKNRTITTLQSDVTYLKSLMGESENKLLDVTKDLEVSKENCQQLSAQLKKIVYQKNEEIADLKRQINKMSVTENRASQIIKVSTKYQTIILKRIAEIKSNTILKELTNFGNSANCDNEVKRNLNAGAITMEDLENFLETTDKHLRKCSEKQLALQKERDRLSEVNKIYESEIINLKKFLTELSVSYRTFSSVRELYEQKLSKIVSLQRTVRREILSLDGQVTDATVCKLERGYAAKMQDLLECAMNMERWVERCIGRTISPEKIKQAFTSDERALFAQPNFQNASLDVQLGELEISFQKLLEESSRAKQGEGKDSGERRDTQVTTVMEVRAEYEDKLSRMKAKMKQLYQEQIGMYKEKQKEEIAVLERELHKAREKFAESSRKYEQHIKALTTELWTVGEKFLMKKDEAEWLRKRQQSGSLMSLQHIHSSGLVPPQVEPSRPSDAHSLRSLPINNNKRGRGLHMSDEEGEVFDNRWLPSLSSPRSARSPMLSPGARLSELRWRNSLCPPHLQSSYPAETQFAPVFNEEDIKCAGSSKMSMGGKSQRKEVGITAYKKPGPPTPSKQAGRLSATDSELRESLRAEADPQPSARKTSTPSRLRTLFRSHRADDYKNEGTPRSRRLSNIFRKK